MTALAMPGSTCTSKFQTLPLVREGEPHKKTQISEDNIRGEEEKLVAGSRWWLDTGQTGRLTVGS
jgi:hypothetical protein